MLSVEEIREQRPTEATVVRWLSIAATVLWVPVIGHLYLAAGAWLISLFFYIFGAFGVAKGRQAARILTVIGLGIIYIPMLPYCVIGFSDPVPNSTAFAVIDIVAVAVSVLSLVLMFRPSTNRYIHLVTVARGAP